MVLLQRTTCSWGTSWLLPANSQGTNGLTSQQRRACSCPCCSSVPLGCLPTGTWCTHVMLLPTTRTHPDVPRMPAYTHRVDCVACPLAAQAGSPYQSTAQLYLAHVTAAAHPHVPVVHPGQALPWPMCKALPTHAGQVTASGLPSTSNPCGSPTGTGMQCAVRSNTAQTSHRLSASLSHSQKHNPAATNQVLHDQPTSAATAQQAPSCSVSPSCAGSSFRASSLSQHTNKP